jgi:dCMP deaminase
MRFSGKIILRQAQDASIVVFPENWSYPYCKIPMFSKVSTMSRVSWDEYFMRIAARVAMRSTCDRKHVGAVIVRERLILSTGYNGSVRGLPHCDDEGHLMVDGHCVATIHAEANAILQAARNGVSTDGATIYITASPCWNCFKMVANSGIKRICFGEFYRDERIFEVSRDAGIELADFSTGGEK